MDRANFNFCLEVNACLCQTLVALWRVHWRFLVVEMHADASKQKLFLKSDTGVNLRSRLMQA